MIEPRIGFPAVSAPDPPVGVEIVGSAGHVHTIAVLVDTVRADLRSQRMNARVAIIAVTARSGIHQAIDRTVAVDVVAFTLHQLVEAAVAVLVDPLRSFRLTDLGGRGVDRWVEVVAVPVRWEPVTVFVASDKAPIAVLIDPVATGSQRGVRVFGSAGVNRRVRVVAVARPGGSDGEQRVHPSASWSLHAASSPLQSWSIPSAQSSSAPGKMVGSFGSQSTALAVRQSVVSVSLQGEPSNRWHKAVGVAVNPSPSGSRSSLRVTSEN